MKEPTLVILAAGMGSRFGGLKQIMPVDPFGHSIIDFSLYDAHRAGFRKVAFIIKHEIEEDFKASIGRRMEKYFDVQYIYQQLDRLPEGYSVPEGRIKPWGTGHAVACCQGVVDGPFAVINSDDFSRGVCSEKDGYLTDVVERTRIEKRGDDAAFTEDGETWVHLPGDTLVSMNCWAFGKSFLPSFLPSFRSHLIFPY